MNRTAGEGGDAVTEGLTNYTTGQGLRLCLEQREEGKKKEKKKENWNLFHNRKENEKENISIFHVLSDFVIFPSFLLLLFHIFQTQP